jgi:hypothetical protein
MSTAISLPPINVLANAADTLATAAQEAGDVANMRALNKAAWHLHNGLTIIPTTNGFLIPSGTRDGVIHRISNVYGCSCEAGAKGKPCWHMSALEVVEYANITYTPPLTQTVEYARALAEMDELYG